MQVQFSNNRKIYNLSAGKSVPDWISERKRRLLEKKDVDVRKRIELIQDFEMPGVSTGIKMSKDCRYVLATGVYKPRIRCYDVTNLSMKFERCFNAEAVQFELLSDDYSKIVLLQCDRNIEFHAQYGCYYRTRIPKYGRDMVYHAGSCDLYLVGASSEVYRLNLQEGRFLNSLQTSASSLNKIAINPHHDLVVCGTIEGKVEAWDPRDRHRAGILDCAISAVSETTNVVGFPSVTALKFKDGLTMAVGMATGQILLYDIRSNKPFMIKDHMYDRPIKCIDFIHNERLVASLDDKIVKVWHEQTGQPFVALQTKSYLNDMCIVPNSGLFFCAVEENKIQTFYVPSIGPAPKWCYFLDNMTEELEESKTESVYDDYKFVTPKDLEDLGLSHLIGTNLLRGYMHGFFIDIRLYNKAKAIVQPYAYREYQKKKIQEKIDLERQNRVMVKKLPEVNKEFAKKLLEVTPEDKKNEFTSLLDDERFNIMFKDSDYAIDETGEEYNHLKPFLNKLEKLNQKKKVAATAQLHEQLEALEEESLHVKTDLSDEEYTSSEEEPEDEMKESVQGGWSDSEENTEKSTTSIKKSKLCEIQDAEDFSLFKTSKAVEVDSSLPLGERLQKVKEKAFIREEALAGDKIVAFSLKKTDSQRKTEERNKQHIKERAMYRRPAKNLRK